MQPGKAIAIGFVAGLAVAGGAVLLLRDETVPGQETARIAETLMHRSSGLIRRYRDCQASRRQRRLPLRRRRVERSAPLRR